MRLDHYKELKKRIFLISNTESQPFELLAKQQGTAEGKVLYYKSGKCKYNNTAGDLTTSDAAKDDLLKFISEDL